jgi:hypothetical protein
MQSSSRYLVAAAAVLIVAVGVYALRPGGGFGGVIATPTPSPSERPSATASPSPTPADTQISAPNFVAPFIITVPTSWSSGFDATHHVGTYTGSSEAGFWGVNVYAGVRLYSDPCHPSAGFTTPGEFASPAELAASLATRPGLTVSAPTAYTSPGHSGLVVSFQYTGSVTGCEPAGGQVEVFATNLTEHDLGINAGYQQRWFITQVKGKLLVIEAWAGSVPLADKMAQLQPIIDSISFE